MTNRYESKKTEEQLTCYSFYFYPIIYMYPGIYLLVLSFDLAVIYNDIVNCSIPPIAGSSYPFKTQLKEKKKKKIQWKKDFSRFRLVARILNGMNSKNI